MEEGGSRLDSINVSVQVARERLGSCTRNNRAILVLVGVVLSVKKALNYLNREIDNNPILSRAIAYIVGINTAFAELLVN